jgi:peptide/nickel transport system ATP-binding protein
MIDRSPGSKRFHSSPAIDESYLITTLLRLMAGLIPPDTGKILLEGTPVTPEAGPTRRRRMGFGLQSGGLFPHLTAADNVTLLARALHRPAEWRNRRLAELGALVRLGPELLSRWPAQLSGGQRQRVAIAIAVVLRPALLIADEPTTALDVIAQAHILALLRELVAARRMGLILVSHDLAVIARVAHRLMVMNDGKIVEERAFDGEEPAQVRRSLRHLRHPYTRALLAAAELPVKRAAAATAGEATAAADVPVAGEGTAPPVLEVRGLTREYRRARRSLWHAGTAFRAVDDVSLNLRAGENVGLVGESGSGKSSLLRAILALDPPQGGEVLLLGEPFSTATGANLRRLRRSIQVVFQDPYGSFDPQWPVERLIAQCQRHGVVPGIQTRSVAMARAGIDKIPTRLPGIRIIAELLFSRSFAGWIACKHAFRSGDSVRSECSDASDFFRIPLNANMFRRGSK